MSEVLEIAPKIKRKTANNPLVDTLKAKQEELRILESEYENIANTIAEKEEKFKIEIDILQNEYENLLFAGIYNEKLIPLRECADTMHDELIHNINNIFPVINKSPYSCSMYSAPKTWEYTEPNSYSVSDHWNFYSRGKYHKLTVQNPYEFAAKKYPNSNTIYYWWLAKFVEGAKGYDEHMNDLASEPSGAWELIDVFPRDSEKYKKIKDILTEKLKKERELRQLTPEKLASDISKEKKEVELLQWLIAHNYKSIEIWGKEALKKLKSKYNEIDASVREKINQGLITGKITKKDWSGRPGHFRLSGENTYRGRIIGITATTITIKTDDGNYYTGKDYSIDYGLSYLPHGVLNDDEWAVFHGWELCDKTIFETTGNNAHKICYSKKFKL